MITTLKDLVEKENACLHKIDNASFEAGIYKNWEQWETDEQIVKYKNKYDEAIATKEEGEKELVNVRKEIKKYLLDILENY